MFDLDTMSEAQKFVTFDYQETKDLCLHFLTLVSAILVFSLNFTDKVYDFHNANKKKKQIIIGSWCLLLLAIVFCGIGLLCITRAGGIAAYEQEGYEVLAGISYLFIVAGGSSFVAGIGMSIYSVILSGESNSKE